MICPVSESVRSRQRFRYYPRWACSVVQLQQPYWPARPVIPVITVPIWPPCYRTILMPEGKITHILMPSTADFWPGRNRFRRCLISSANSGKNIRFFWLTLLWGMTEMLIRFYSGAVKWNERTDAWSRRDHAESDGSLSAGRHSGRCLTPLPDEHGSAEAGRRCGTAAAKKASHPQDVVITGVKCRDEKHPVIYNIAATANGIYRHESPFLTGVFRNRGSVCLCIVWLPHKGHMHGRCDSACREIFIPQYRGYHERKYAGTRWR